MRLKLEHIAPCLRIKVKTVERPWPKQAQQKCAKHESLKSKIVMDIDMITDDEIEGPSVEVDAEEEFRLNNKNARSYSKKKSKHFLNKGGVKNN